MPRVWRHRAGGFNLERYALDSIELMQQLGHHRFSFAGYSIGLQYDGGIGMNLDLNHADKLEKLELTASIGTKGLVSDSFRTNVDARLEARRNKGRNFF